MFNIIVGYGLWFDVYEFICGLINVGEVFLLLLGIYDVGIVWFSCRLVVIVLKGYELVRVLNVLKIVCLWWVVLGIVILCVVIDIIEWFGIIDSDFVELCYG